MDRLCKILLLNLIPYFIFGQISGSGFADKNHFLLDSIVLEKLGEYDRHLLDTGLVMYHSSKSDTSRINALVFISEEIYDPIWFRYNKFLKRECEKLLGRNSLPAKTKKKYKSILAGTINNYGYFFSNRGRPEEAMEFYKQSLRILEEIGAKHASAQSLGNIGFQYNELGEVDSALIYYRRALEIQREFGDLSGMANAFNNLASVQMDRSDIKSALSYYDSSMNIYRDLKDRSGQALIMNNIAISYLDQNEDSLARIFLMRSMEIREELGDKRGLAGVLNNIGTLYNKPESRNEAMDYFQRSLEISREMEDPTGIAASLGHIGDLYSDLGNFQKSLEYHQNAYEMRQKTKDKEGISFSLAALARVYLKLGDPQKSADAGEESLKLAKELGFTENIESAALVLHQAYHELGQWENALTMHKLYIVMRDSIYNQYSRKEALKRQMRHEFEKREALKNAENAQQLQLMAESEERQKMISLGSGMGMIIVIFFSMFVYNKLKESQKQKRTIEIQKKQAEEIHNALAKKNKEVMDSIQYAKRIQQALLKSEEYQTKHLPEHFILFLPKDIVSGDFYWAMEKENYFYFAAADCTGHGVPGAFLTMLGTSFLNEINATDEVFTPAELLDNLREKIIKELSQTGDNEATKDGMDISMMRLNLKTNSLDWTGAHNPLYHIRAGVMNVIKPDKQPIGYHEYMTPFTNHEIQLKKGDLIYLFTDGYADQFGGEEGKKFMYKAFKEKIMSICELPIEDQKEDLRETFKAWKGKLPQVDDVCIIGLKI